MYPFFRVPTAVVVAVGVAVMVTMVVVVTVTTAACDSSFGGSSGE